MSPLDRIRTRKRDAAPEPGMVLAEALPKVRRGETAPLPVGAAAPSDPALADRRERLAERFTLMQLELGGLFYEMATRDHVVMDVLLARAAELQKVDAELAHVDELASGRAVPGGTCVACGAPHARGAAFCWQCGASLDAQALPAEPDAGTHAAFGEHSDPRGTYGGPADVGYADPDALTQEMDAPEA